MRAMTLMALLVLPGLAWADPTERAERLATLRAEVETLGHDLQMEQTALSSRLQTLDLSRSELEVQIRQEELQLAQLQLQLDEQDSKASTQEASLVLIPAVHDGLDRLRPVIEAGLPYRVPERLAALDELRTGLDAGTLPPHRAVGRLWQTIEDELRLGRENGIDRQTIPLQGEEVLVDVARLGLVSLYFRTTDGRVGWAERSGNGWTWVDATDREARGQILALFDALEKQIRVGAFTVPAALPPVSR